VSRDGSGTVFAVSDRNPGMLPDDLRRVRDRHFSPIYARERIANK
jgi:hypothetical protein